MFERDQGKESGLGWRQPLGFRTGGCPLVPTVPTIGAHRPGSSETAPQPTSTLHQVGTLLVGEKTDCTRGPAVAHRTRLRTDMAAFSTLLFFAVVYIAVVASQSRFSVSKWFDARS